MHEEADAAEAPHEVEGLVLDELLVEDVSIDGMCGVY
jgi:mycofactocin precursor